MKPNFCLSLSFDGIRLYFRGETGWTEIGEVSLEADDLTAELASLRTAAEECAPEGIRATLVIPNEQIKYITLPDRGLGDDAVRAALEGATPYSVDELTFDFAESEAGTSIAAVANETLEEAEGFAVEHAFGPVSFVAAPVEGTFPGEPFFGKTKAAGDSPVTRDDAPVSLSSISPVSDDAPTDTPAESTQDEPSEQVEDDAESPRDTNALDDEAQSDAEPDGLADEPEPTLAVAAGDDVSDEPQEEPPVEEEPVSEPDSAKAEEDTSEEEDSPVAEEAAAEVVEAVEATADDADDAAPLEEGSDEAAEPASQEPPSEPVVEDDDAAKDSEPARPAPAEPVFSSRLKTLREELGSAPPPAPPVGQPATQPSAPRLGAAQRASSSPSTGAATPMPPALAAALRKAETRETVPPREVGAASPVGIAGPVSRPATPPPPAVSKELKKKRNGLDFDALNGDRVAPPIPGAGPQAPVRSAPPALPSAPSRSDLPPPVEPVAKAAQAPSGPAETSAEIPAPPAGIAASLTAKDGPAASGRFSRFGRASKQASSKAPAAASTKPAQQGATRTDAEKERLTVFGARRKEQEVGGKPRFLGLILTAVLVLLMAAVAAWATFAPASFSRVLGLSDSPASVSETGPDGQTPALAAEPPAVNPAPASQAVEPTPLPASESPVAPGSIPTGEMLISGTGSLLPDPDLLRALAAPTPADAVAEAPGAVLSPAAAERFYAATGVWLRAPRLSEEPQPATLGTVTRLVNAPPPSIQAAPELPRMAPDPVLAARVNPPPPDMRFERDDRGFLLATPEGTVTPYGLIIYAGSPSIVPPTRPGTPPVVEPPEEAVVASPAPVEEAAPTEIAEAPAGPTGDPPASEETARIVVDATESLASEALAVLEQVPARPDARISTAGALNAAAIDLNGLRPALRPDDQVPDALLPEVELASFVGPRPPLRPEGLAPVEETPTEEEAPPSSDVEDALAGILAGAADPLATATPLAVASTIRPDSRPRNFDRVVQQARARQSQPSTPSPSSGAQPEQVSNAAAQPSGPVPQTVASAATQENAINLRQINLIGVYGRPSDRHALVRLANGRYVRVSVGDRLDGGRVAAINDNTLNYVKSGRTLTLEIPSG